MIHRQLYFGNSQWNCWHMVFSLSLHFIQSKRFAPSNEIKKKISIGPVCPPLNWCGVPFRNRSPKVVSWEHLYTTPELWYTYIMSTWNTCNINNTAWKFTLNLSKKYSVWTISSNRIHFTRTLYIFFDACKLSWCLHVRVHEIDTGTKSKDPQPPFNFKIV